MKKNLLWLLIPVVLLAIWAPAMGQVQQVLTNGDMESWVQNGRNGPPDHWSFVTPHISLVREPDLIHSGSYAAKAIYDSSGTLKVQHEPVAVVPSTVYSCSLWFYDNWGGGNGGPVGPRARVWFVFSPSGSGGPDESHYSLDTAGYKLYTYSMTAPATAQSLTIQIRYYGGASDGLTDSIYVDDIVLWGEVPSGNTPPSISIHRTPSDFTPVYPTDYIYIYSTIVDPDPGGSIAADSMYYQLNGGAWIGAIHDSITVSNHNYWYHIGTNPAGTAVNYYGVAYDNIGARSQSGTYNYTVINPTPPHVPIYSLEHTVSPGTLPNCYPSDSLGLTEQIIGVVTGRYERTGRHNWFFVQDADSLWTGVFVYSGPNVVDIGDSVTVSGLVNENYSETEISTITAFTLMSSGNAIPAPKVVTCATFAGTDSCLASAEPYEGMLIQINNVNVIDSLHYPDSGSFWGIDGSGDSCIIADDLSLGGATPAVIEVGHTYGYVRGIGRYTFGRYRIMPRIATDLYSAPLVCTGSNIFNVENSVNPGSDSLCWPSPLNGDTVTICGIVTAVQQGTTPRFFLQDQANTAWGGIHVFDYTVPNGDPASAVLGDYLQLTGHVNEYYGWTEIDTLLAVTHLGTLQPLPDTTVIADIATLSVLCSYTAEPFENVLVRVENVTVVADNGNDEYWIRDTTGPDSMRIDSDLWTGGTNQPNPLPSVGASYNYIIGVVKWEGRQGAGYDRGWILLPRFASDYNIAVIPAPAVVNVWSINPTTLAATFDRAMDPTTTGNAANYSTHNGLSIISGALDPLNSRKVILTTATQPNNLVDTLIVNNVCDSLGHCMTVANRKLYHSGYTPISLTNYPFGNADTAAIYNQIVTIKGAVVADTSMTYPNNMFIDDGSGPPYNGVLLFLPAFTPFPHMGDTIAVSAWVSEYFGQTELTGVSTLNNLTIVHAGPTPVPVPYHVTAHDLFANGEAYEGVLVAVCDSFTITSLSPDTSASQYGFEIKSISSPNDSIIVHQQGPLHTRYTYTPTVGARIVGITGVYRFQRGQYRIMPRFDADFNSFATWCQVGPVTCAYRPGDINGNGATNGIDVTYGVGYFKGGLVPPNNCGTPVGPCPQASPFYAAGDVNGSCVFNGIDITFFVGYLKGSQPALLHCPTCPPTTLESPAVIIPSLTPLKISGQNGNAQ
jgi:hypothetical protein